MAVVVHLLPTHVLLELVVGIALLIQGNLESLEKIMLEVEELLRDGSLCNHLP